MSLTVVDHPLAQHLLTRLRDVETPPPVFRTLAKRLTIALVLEAVRGLPTVEMKVDTPLEPADGRLISPDLVAVPILRAEALTRPTSLPLDSTGKTSCRSAKLACSSIELSGVRKDSQPALRIFRGRRCLASFFD